MYKIKIRLDTQSDVTKFVSLAESFNHGFPIYLEDGCGHCVNARSILGVMYGKIEFKDLYVRSDSEQISTLFEDFMI